MRRAEEHEHVYGPWRFDHPGLSDGGRFKVRFCKLCKYVEIKEV